MTVPVEPFGDAAWRVPLPPGAHPRALLDALRAIPSVVDAVVTEEHALVAFDPASPPSRGGVQDAVLRSSATRATAEAGREHVVQVRYDGVDLEEVARETRMTAHEVAALHAAPTYVVATIGFMPGFAYLRGIEARLVLPRRSSPRARVPALAIGIAGPYTGVYPFASPGGWHLLGTAVGFVPFDARSGATLALGDRVRFVAVPP
ncbi:MAG TPA: carboxyltransferase domain-containing protein [Polyangiaceae bacterium]